VPAQALLHRLHAKQLDRLFQYVMVERWRAQAPWAACRPRTKPADDREGREGGEGYPV